METISIGRRLRWDKSFKLISWVDLGINKFARTGGFLIDNFKTGP